MPNVTIIYGPSVTIVRAAVPTAALRQSIEEQSLTPGTPEYSRAVKLRALQIAHSHIATAIRALSAADEVAAHQAAIAAAQDAATYAPETTGNP